MYHNNHRRGIMQKVGWLRNLLKTIPGILQCFGVKPLIFIQRKKKWTKENYVTKVKAEKKGKTLFFVSPAGLAWKE